jgi:hypothetical protein
MDYSGYSTVGASEKGRVNEGDGVKSLLSPSLSLDLAYTSSDIELGLGLGGQGRSLSLNQVSNV